MSQLSSALLCLAGPRLRDQLFDANSRERLQRAVDIDWSTVVENFQNVPDEILADVQVIVGGWGMPPIDDRVLLRMPALRLVAYAAGSIRTFATPALFERGIRVTSAAAANATPVAQYALAMIVLANKRLLNGLEDYRLGRQPNLDDAGSVGKTVGVVGASLIGRLVIEGLRGLPVKVIVADPTITKTDASALGADLVSLDDLMSASDVISLHAPLLPETRGMIGKRQLAAMRHGSTLINTARGGLVDHDALRVECTSGRIDAILDVTDPEPLAFNDVLRTLPNVMLTPHMAGAVGHELKLLGEAAVIEVERFIAGQDALYGIVASDLPLRA